MKTIYQKEHNDRAGKNEFRYITWKVNSDGSKQICDVTQLSQKMSKFDIKNRKALLAENNKCDPKDLEMELHVVFATQWDRMHPGR